MVNLIHLVLEYPMMYITVLYWIQYMDKTTLGSSAILGIKASAHLSASEYNWLGTIFYLSYLVFEYPQNLALQRFPVGKWMRSVDLTSILKLLVMIIYPYTIASISSYGESLFVHTPHARALEDCLLYASSYVSFCRLATLESSTHPIAWNM